MERTITINVAGLTEAPQPYTPMYYILELFKSCLQVGLTFNHDSTSSVEYVYSDALVRQDSKIWNWRPDDGTLAINGTIHKIRTPVFGIEKNNKLILELLETLNVPYGVKLVYVSNKAFIMDKRVVEALSRPEFMVIIPDELKLGTTTKARLIKNPNVRIVAGSAPLASVSDIAIIGCRQEVCWFNCLTFCPQATREHGIILNTITNALQHGFPRAGLNIKRHPIDVTTTDAGALDTDYFDNIANILRTHEII